jgi:hypothetical protein
MKDYLHSLVDEAASPFQGRNVIREYLQARILGSLQQSGAMIPMAFHGGTALRFLYSHGRYSEDLDFSLARDSRSYNFAGYLEEIRNMFSAEAYPVEVNFNDQKTVNSAFIRFPGLLHEMGLSAQSNEVLAIKIEVDTHPSAGAGFETTVVRRFVILQVQHHDKASLLSGKIYAILQRPYSKGRDLYDLLWYLSDPAWPEPNLGYLNNALSQTNWPGEQITSLNLRMILWNKLTTLNWRSVVDDVRPFLEPGFDVNLISMENLKRVLKIDLAT